MNLKILLKRSLEYCILDVKSEGLSAQSAYK